MTFLDDERIREESILVIGEVIEVLGRTVKVEVFREKNGAVLLYRGNAIKNVAVGSYIKIAKGFTQIVGIVEGERVVEDRRTNSEYSRRGDNSKRILDVSVIGSIENGRFEPGVKELPLVGSTCSLLSEAEIGQTLETGADMQIRLGHLLTNQNQPVYLDVSKVLASHIGIFGNTGSGKSYTLAKILSEVFSRYAKSNDFLNQSRFLLIDFNGEYSGSGTIADDALVKRYSLSTRKPIGGDRLPLPIDTLSDAKVWQVFLDATEKTQSPFLARVFRKQWVKDLVNGIRTEIGDKVMEIVEAALSTSDRTLDRNLAKNFLFELSDYIDSSSRNHLETLLAKVSAVSYHSNAGAFYFMDSSGSKRYSNESDWRPALKAYLNIPGFSISCDAGKLRILGAAIVLCYYDEATKGYSNAEHLAPLIKRLNSRIGDLEKVVSPSSDKLMPKTLTIVSLRDVNIEMRKIIPMLVCSYAYDDVKRSGSYKYLSLVIDEAHNILSEESSRESEQWKSYRLETFEEIVKEGRKYGVFLVLASQRPYDISPTIISQLHNYFIHRLMNEKDLKAIERAVSYIDRLSFDSIPVLPTGACIASGTAFNRPLVVEVEMIEHGNPPASNTIDVEQLWHDCDGGLQATTI